MTPLVYIIVLNWNGKDLTVECLQSLSKCKYKNFKVLVADNGSTDNSVKTIQKEFPEVDILELENNIGFAAGNNAGFKAIGKHYPHYVIFLNNDTNVDKNFIEPLINPLENSSDIGQTVPKILYYSEKKRIWYSGGKVNLWLGIIYHIGIRKYDSDKFSRSKITDYATGCCFAMRYSDFEKIGGFDVTYPMYCEDVDLSLRIRKTGKKILYVPTSKIQHRVSASIGGEFSWQKLKRKFQALIKLLNKHAAIMQKITALFYQLITLPLQIIRLLYLAWKK